jgi:hypothetical protein
MNRTFSYDPFASLENDSSLRSACVAVAAEQAASARSASVMKLAHGPEDLSVSSQSRPQIGRRPWASLWAVVSEALRVRLRGPAAVLTVTIQSAVLPIGV